MPSAAAGIPMSSNAGPGGRTGVTMAALDPAIGRMLGATFRSSVQATSALAVRSAPLAIEISRTTLRAATVDGSRMHSSTYAVAPSAESAACRVAYQPSGRVVAAIVRSVAPVDR